MIHTADLAWAAGFLESQGLFGASLSSGQVNVAAAGSNPEPLRNLQAVLGGRLYSYVDRHDRPHWRWLLTGPAAVGVAFTLYRWLSRRRRNQLGTVLAKWRQPHPLPRHHVLAGAPTGE